MNNWNFLEIKEQGNCKHIVFGYMRKHVDKKNKGTIA